MKNGSELLKARDDLDKDCAPNKKAGWEEVRKMWIRRSAFISIIDKINDIEIRVKKLEQISIREEQNRLTDLRNKSLSEPEKF